MVTHPFHALRGQRLHVLEERRYRSVGHVLICEDAAFGRITLPVDFTDRSLTPAGRILSVDVLAELAAVIIALEKGLTATGGPNI